MKTNNSVLDTVGLFLRIALVIISGVMVWVDRADWAILLIAWAIYLKVCAYVR